MFNVRQIYPLLMSAFRLFSTDDFTTLLRISSILSFRYNVVGNQPPNEQERIYTLLAEGLATGRFPTLTALIPELKPIYPKDAVFKNAFSEKILKTTQSRNRLIVRYILFKLEGQESGTDYDFESDRYNIEHILPENPADGWEQVSDQEQEQFVYRLGNMTIMQAGPNRAVGNAPYQDKMLVYETSEFLITRRIAESYVGWDTNQIANRQRQMAAMATSIWRVSQLS
jgi:hypothetical protein